MEPQNPDEETREIWDTLHCDMHEERKLEELDRQMRLRGMWLHQWKDGCPHRFGVRDTVDHCEIEGTPCVYETASGYCELFRQIIAERIAEAGIVYG